MVATAKARRLSDVAAEPTLEPPVSTSDLAGPPSIDEDWLVISTIHSAKGLEWDVVHLLSATDVAIKSPSDGLPPYELERVLGRATLRPLAADDNIRFEDLGEGA